MSYIVETMTGLPTAEGPIPLNIDALTERQSRIDAKAAEYLKRIRTENPVTLANQLAEEHVISAEQLAGSQQLSTIDKLTNLLNARGIDDALEKEIGIFQRHSFQNGQSEQKPLVLLMVDGDKIKDINDSFGHSVGDIAIIEIAKSIKSSASRDKDSSGRSGGDEFKVILPETDIKGALQVAEEMRIGVIKAAQKDPRFSGLSVCVGVAIYDGTETKEKFVNRADEAMYRAKKRRNCIVLHYNDIPKDTQEQKDLDQFITEQRIKADTISTKPI